MHRSKSFKGDICGCLPAVTSSEAFEKDRALISIKARSGLIVRSVVFREFDKLEIPLKGSGNELSFVLTGLVL